MDDRKSYGKFEQGLEKDEWEIGMLIRDMRIEKMIDRRSNI